MQDSKRLPFKTLLMSATFIALQHKGVGDSSTLASTLQRIYLRSYMFANGMHVDRE